MAIGKDGKLFAKRAGWCRGEGGQQQQKPDQRQKPEQRDEPERGLPTHEVGDHEAKRYA